MERRGWLRKHSEGGVQRHQFPITCSHRPGSGQDSGDMDPNVTACSSGEELGVTLKFQSGQWANGSPASSPYSGFVRMRTRLPFLQTLCHHPLETCMYKVWGLQCQCPPSCTSATYTIPLGSPSRHSASEQALGRWSAGTQAGRKGR